MVKTDTIKAQEIVSNSKSNLVSNTPYHEKKNQLKTESYSNIIIDNNYIKSNKIFSMEMTIDLNIAYAEYTNQS